MKNNWFRFLLLSLTLVLAFSFFACDEQQKAPESAVDRILSKGVLRIGMDPGYLPFEMKDRQGELMGFDVDLAYLLGDTMGVRVEFIPPSGSYATMLDDLKANRFDIIISGMTITPQRNLKIMFSDPYITVGQAILANNRHRNTIRNADDLNSTNYLVVYLEGTTGAAAVDRFLPRARRIAVSTQQEGVAMVREGRADAFVYDLPAFATLVAKEGKNVFHFIDQPLTFEPIGMGLRFTDHELLNLINNFTRQIQADGTYDTLYDRWFIQTGWFQRL
ncbi:transporter substrate-binding domain-containing protein [Desulfobotulus sp. H1]|uniref:Transporter substrate-binding domain-containing protein n=1 Tax=Desulfobotulus pelophilus TaxID=2823377 RepID=A0ABT3N909_9BACT|nr:transporter substrate-binding domain-containing protein [Desulfobotulus pelophilus]MCW7753676.1 transporter substrate-binding domain-containing protein [Desulfobotulus pelophilus]